MLTMDDIRRAAEEGARRAPAVAAERQEHERREREEQERKRQAEEEALWKQADDFLAYLPKRIASATAQGQGTVDLLCAEDERDMRKGWCGKVLQRLQSMGLKVTFRDDAREDVNSESPRWVGLTWMVVAIPAPGAVA